MPLSAPLAIVRAAFSETFEVSAASTASRRSGSVVTFSFAESLTASIGRFASHALPVAVRSFTSRRAWISWRRSRPVAAGTPVSSSSPLTAGARPPSMRESALACSSLPVVAGSAWAPALASIVSRT